MMTKIKNIAITMIVVVSMIFVGCVIPTYASDTKTVYIGYYLTDDQENYINWDGEKIDPEQRILLYKQTKENLPQGSHFFSKRTIHYSNKEIKTAVGMKYIDYKGTNHCELMFGAYLDNKVTFMDWKSATDHTYIIKDDKSIRFPYNFEYKTGISTEKDGYTFVGWYDKNGMRFNEDSLVKENLTVYARYVKNDSKYQYKINHYIEQLNGQYMPYESENLEGEKNQVIQAIDTYKTGLTGFHFNVSKSDNSIKLDKEGKELNLFYDRDIKTVAFQDGQTIINTQRIKYEDKAKVPAKPQKEGFEFVKWNSKPDGHGRDFDTQQPVTYDSIYYAIYKALPSYSYQVHYYLQNGEQYLSVKKDNHTVFQGTNINATDEQKNMFEGYRFNEERSSKNVTILQNNQVVSFYYDQIEYPYTIEYYYDNILDSQKTETKVAHLNDHIRDFVDKNKEGFELLKQPSLIIEKEQNVLRVDYVRQVFQVRFLDHNGKTIVEEMVKYGDAVQAPIAPEVIGKHFIGWDHELSNITSHTDIQAQYATSTYQVIFQDMNGEIIKTQTVDYGQDATLPQAPDVEGYEFIGWQGKYQNIQQDETVIAQYRQIEQSIVPPIDNPDDLIPPAHLPNNTPSETITNEVPQIVGPETILTTPVMVPTMIPPQQTLTDNPLLNQQPIVDNQQTVPVEEEMAQIVEQETPKTKGAIEKQWALVNFIAVILTILLSIVLMLSKHGEEKENENMKNRRRWTKVGTVIIALASLIIFLLTENIFLSMTFTDQYTIMMLGLVMIQLLLVLIGRKYKNNNKQVVIHS